MPARNVLAVLLENGQETRLHEAIAERAEAPAQVHVVAPLQVGALDWLATAEDDARAEASARAEEAEQALAGSADVSGEPGESDPVQAVEDALRTFAADEIVLVGDAGDDELERSLERFGLPVTRIRG
jgi:hypothetical protein